MEDIFGTKTTKQGSKGSSETDSGALCDSKHEVWVYTTDYLNDGSITPGEDNIIVSFVGTDSSGTGCVGDILSGGLKIFTDPVDWYSTVTTGFGEALADEDSWIGRDSVIGDAAVDSGVAGGIVAVGDAVLDIPSNAGKIWDHYTDDCYITTAVMKAEGNNNSPELTSMRKLRDRYGNWFAADEVREYYQIAPLIVANINRSSKSSQIYKKLHSEYIVPAHQQVTQGNYGTAHKIYKNMVNYTRRFAADSGQSCFDDFGGTVLHNSNGRGHKISIKITCNGETMYDTEMAGSDKREKSGDNLLYLGTNKSFKITKPGTWRVTVESLSSHAECATPTLDKTWTINVPKPAGWDESAPTIQTQTQEVKAITTEINSQLKQLGIKEGTDPLTIFAGIVIGGGILTFGLLSYLGSDSKKEEDSE
tara:strand:- start:5480 stop:6739 length:1260 start_codon:yes stop_codon:yes gene_type:complete